MVETFTIVKSGDGYLLDTDNGFPAMTSDPMFARRFYIKRDAETVASLLKCLGWEAELVEGKKGLYFPDKGETK